MFVVKSAESVSNATLLTVYVSLLLLTSNRGTTALVAAVLPSNNTQSPATSDAKYTHDSIVKSLSVPSTAPNAKSASDGIV